MERGYGRGVWYPDVLVRIDGHDGFESAYTGNSDPEGYEELGGRCRL